MSFLNTMTSLVDRIRDLVQQKDALAASLQAKVSEQAETIVNLQNQVAKALSQDKADQDAITQAQTAAQTSQAAFETYKQESEAKLQEMEAANTQFTQLLEELTQQAPETDSKPATEAPSEPLTQQLLETDTQPADNGESEPEAD